METVVFNFTSDVAIRSLGTNEAPFFVVSDLCKALGYQNTSAAVAKHVFQEDVQKFPIATKSGIQHMLCTNESGLYALIFGSKLETAKTFKRWVTNEVLPSIRKTGKYELPRDTITVEEQYCIRKAVAYNRKRTGRHYREVYNDLYNEFRIPRYTELKREDFDKAMAFLGQTESEQETIDFEPQQAPALEDGSVVLSPSEAESLLAFIFRMRYVFPECFVAMYKFLAAVKSPMAGRFYEFAHDWGLGKFETLLANNGYLVQDLDCYKHWLSNKSDD